MFHQRSQARDRACPNSGVVVLQWLVLPCSPNGILRYARWVIADGEPDRDVGEVFDWFALTFWTEAALASSKERSRSAVPVDDYKYRVVAEVTYLSERACIIDFGLKATASSDRLSAGCKKGDYVTGEICLNLPLGTEVGPEEVFKKLAHRRQVKRISADMTPYVPHPDYSGGSIRDASQVRYQDVPDTSSVRADSYVHCSEVLPE